MGLFLCGFPTPPRSPAQPWRCPGGEHRPEPGRTQAPKSSSLHLMWLPGSIFFSGLLPSLGQCLPRASPPGLGPAPTPMAHPPRWLAPSSRGLGSLFPASPSSALRAPSTFCGFRTQVQPNLRAEELVVTLRSVQSGHCVSCTRQEELSVLASCTHCIVLSRLMFYPWLCAGQQAAPCLKLQVEPSLSAASLPNITSSIVSLFLLPFLLNLYC